MSIRIAKENDVSQIRNLVMSLSHYYLSDPSENLPAWFEDTLSTTAFNERITNTEYQNLVFEENETIVGYISIKNGSHVYHLFVSSAFQGKGIARLLWEHARKLTGSGSYSLRSSIYAVPVYQRFGFVESGPVGYKDGIVFQAMELSQEC